MKRACATMAVYNEADVVLEAVTKLIHRGVDVYLIETASSDGRSARLADLVGQGGTDVEPQRFMEEGLRMLDYNWYRVVDADEIRLPRCR